MSQISNWSNIAADGASKQSGGKTQKPEMDTTG